MASDPDHLVKWAQQGTAENGFVYDEICLLNEKPFPFRANRETLLNDLTQAFPHQAEALKLYFRRCEEICRASKMHFLLKIAPLWMHKWLEPLFCRQFHRSSHLTALEVLQSIFTDKKLIAILLGQFGDHGVAPDKASFFLHAGVFTHYFKGGYYPVDGPRTIARALVPTILKSGGRVLVRAPVAEILLADSGQRALGVRMQSGHVITAPTIISGAGVRNTYCRLLSAENAAKAELPTAIFEKIGPSVAHICTFVGLTGSSQELNLPSSNQWIIPAQGPDYDVCASIDRFVADPLNPDVPMFAFVAFPSAKDPLARNGDRSTVSMITEARLDWFSQLAIPGSKKGRRGDDYKAHKAAFERRLLALLFQQFPQLKDKVKYVVSSTPLTTQHYIGALSGESYGLNMPPERFSATLGLLTRPQVQSIPNLFLTGQDIVSAGVSAALMGGLLCAHAVLGYGTLYDLITGRNLIQDIRSLSRKSKSQ